MRLRGLLVGLFLAGLVLGCGGKFDRVHYEMVTPGMTAEQVLDRMGQPDSRTSDEWVYQRTIGDRCRAVIGFRDGRVVEKTWNDFGPTDGADQSAE